MDIVANREQKDPDLQKIEYMKIKVMIEKETKRPNVRTAETNSMGTSHGGTAFAQKRVSTKKKREKGSEIDSKNTGIVFDASVGGDDMTSMASGRTGTKASINIQVPLTHTNTNNSNSALKRINKGGGSPGLRLEKHAISKGRQQESNEPNSAEMEAFLHKEQFITYCKDILTRPKRKQQNINESKQQTEEQQSVDEIGKFVHTSVKKTLHGDEKFEKMQQ